MRAADLHRLARTLREIALLATGNTGTDAVTPGELAVIEDVARHPSSTVSDVTRRTGLAQSLVSRIVRSMSEQGLVAVTADPDDGRKVRLALAEAARPGLMARADRSSDAALAARTMGLDEAERRQLLAHLRAAAALLAKGADS